jgi:Flp pilus assembly protein TadG
MKNYISLCCEKSFLEPLTAHLREVGSNSNIFCAINVIKTIYCYLKAMCFLLGKEITNAIDRHTIKTIFLCLKRDKTGLAALEFTILSGMLLTVMLNGIEVSRYYYGQMQMQNATQMAVQAVWKTCDTSAKLPATVNCSGRASAITTALQSTSLGSSVSLQTGSPTEGYFCVSTAGSLTSVGAANASRPANCGSVGSSTDVPKIYIQIAAQYTYAPLFQAITIGSALPTTITSTSSMRLE